MQEEREKHKKVSPLLLTTELPEVWNMTTIEVQRVDGSYSQVQLPTTMALTPEHLLYVLFEFKNKAKVYGWNGAEVFEKFHELLTGNARTQWDVIRSSSPPSTTRENFERTVQAMVSNLAGSKQSYDNFLNYLNHAKKPMTMNPSVFITRCLTLFRYVPYLSVEDGTAPALFSDLQQKKFVIKMLPERWQQRMEDAGISAANTGLPSILEFMNNQWKRELMDKGGNKRNNTSYQDN